MTGGEDIYVSFYQRDDGEILLLVSNLGEEPADVTLRFDDEILDRRVSGPVMDALSGVQIGEYDVALALELEPWRLRMLRIGDR